MYDVNSGNIINHSIAANNVRNPRGNHLAPNRRNIRKHTSWGDNRSGVPSAYCGANLNLVEHSSHLPSPRVTSNQDVKQS